MTDQHFSGKWTGEYTYGEDYPDLIRGKKVAFEITIAFVNGLLQGECVDDEATIHFNQPATIEGSVHENFISFIKRYPHYWQMEEQGPRFLPKLPSQEVHYSGCFTNGQFEGDWEIITQFANDHGDLFAFKGTGHWYMKKM